MLEIQFFAASVTDKIYKAWKIVTLPKMLPRN